MKNFFLSSEESGSEVYNVNLCRSQNETSEGLDDGPQEVYKEDPNKNKNNNTPNKLLGVLNYSSSSKFLFNKNSYLCILFESFNISQTVFFISS